MKRTNQCLKCGSNEIIADAKALDNCYGGPPDMSVATFRKPDAIMFKGQTISTLSAWVCGDCGYVELYADKPGLIKRAFAEGHRRA